LPTVDDSQCDGACGDSVATGGDSERVTAKTVAQVLRTPRPATPRFRPAATLGVEPERR